MRNVRSLLLASVLALGGGLIGTSEGRADLVLTNGTVVGSFVTVGGAGFGAQPRLLTLQDNTGSEAGQIVAGAGGTVTATSFLGENDVAPPLPPSQKNDAPTIAALGWTSGDLVKIGFNTTENSTDLTLTDLVLTVYNSAGGVEETFAYTGADILFTAAALALQTGNGNAIFQFQLDAAQQADWNTLLAEAGSSTYRIGLASRLINVEGGPESFLAVLGPTGIPLVPLPGALMLFASGLVGLALLNRRRRQVAA